MLALVVVEIVVELIGNGSKLIEQIVHVLVEPWPPRLGEQIRNLLLARVQNLSGVGQHAFIGNVAASRRPSISFWLMTLSSS